MSIIAPPQQGSIPISAAVVTSAILQNVATTDGNGTDYNITGMATVQLLVAPISYTGTVTFWASIDGTTFIKVRGNQQDTTTIADNVANPGSTASLWTFQTAGLTKIRAVMSSSGGTSCTVTGAASPFPNSCPLGVTLSSAVLAAGTAVIGSTMIQSVSGTALGADVSNTELKVSNYGKSSAAGDTAILTDTFGNLGVSPYPPGATPLTAASGNVAAGTAAATLAKATGKTTYITGFEVTGAGATVGAAVSVTVVGVITGTLTYTYAAVTGATLINTPLIVQFSTPIPSSTTNTDIVVSCPTLGTGNLNNTVVAHGYRL